MLKNALAALGVFIFLSFADLASAQEAPIYELDRRQSGLEIALPASQTPMEQGKDGSGQFVKVPQTKTSGFGYYTSKDGTKVHNFSIKDTTDTYWYLKEDAEGIRSDMPALKPTGKLPEEFGQSRNNDLR